jgi:peptide/nickel transport system permease protein
MDVSDAYLELIAAQFGLDKPLHEQYFIYIGNVFQGNFAFSFTHGLPVLDIILDRLPATLLLMLGSLAVSSLVGVTVGTYVTKKPFGFLDKIVSFFSLIGYSMPVFVSGLFLLYIGSLILGWFPMGGMSTVASGLTGIPYIIDVLWHLTLPALVLGFYHFAFVSRLTRAAMLDTIKQDFMTTARSKGLTENAILFKHGLKNASLPVMTNIGVRLGLSFAGAVLTEIVFSWPGIGRLLYTSMLGRDYPVMMGIFIFVSLAVILSNLVVDLLYAKMDPRVRLK